LLKRRTIAHFQNEQMTKTAKQSRVGQTLICSFAQLLIANIKRAIVRLVAPMLFKKERMRNHSFCCSLLKNGRGIALFVTWAIAHFLICSIAHC